MIGQADQSSRASRYQSAWLSRRPSAKALRIFSVSAARSSGSKSSRPLAASRSAAAAPGVAPPALEDLLLRALDIRRREAAPAEQRGIPRFARARFDLGRLLLARGEPEAAVFQLEEATRLAPGVARGHRVLGVALLELGRPEQALASFERARVLAPREGASYAGMAAALTALGREQEAREHQRTADRLAVPPDRESAGDALLR